MVKAPEFTHDELEALCYSVSEGDAAKWKALRSGLDKLTEYVNAHRLARDDKASKRVDSSTTVEHVKAFVGVMIKRAESGTLPLEELHALSDLIDKVLEREPRNGGDKN